MPSCPRCLAPETNAYDLNGVRVTHYGCGSRVEGQAMLRSPDCRCREALAICRRYASPGVNTGAHSLANKLIGVLE